MSTLSYSPPSLLPKMRAADAALALRFSGFLIMTLFITLVLRLALPLMLPWLLCVIALCSGELKSALHLASDGLLTPYRLMTAFLLPRPLSLVDLRLQQPTMTWRAP